MHLNPETALDLVEETMPEAELQFWTKHVELCRQCTAALDDWSRLTGWVKRSHLLSAPAEVLAPAIEIFEAPQKILECHTPVRQIVARIVFDSAAQPCVAGVRHAQADQQVLVRQVVSEAEEFDIHVRISTVHDRRDLLGQILPLHNAGFVKHARLHLRLNDKRIGSAELNEFGEFQFTGIPDGRLSLQVDLPHLTVISALYDELD